MRNFRPASFHYIPKSGRTLVWLVVMVALLWGALPQARSANQSGPRPERRSVAADYGALPLAFETNAGQADEATQFVSRGPGYTVSLKKDEAVLALRRSDARSRKRFEARKFFRTPRFRHLHKTTVVHVKPVGANHAPAVRPLDPLPGLSNYFIGNSPKFWRTGIPRYGRVRYADVYPGINLTYYGTGNQLEFDFEVAPGADPRQVRLRIESEGKLVVGRDGAVQVRLEDDNLKLLKPIVYQLSNGRRTSVPGRFVRLTRDEVGLRIGPYNHRKPLVIDPVLSYSTYIGGSGADWGEGVAVDSAGNAYITGDTTSLDFPALNGYSASGNANGVCFISKLDPTGKTLLFSTYLGGTGGDWCFGVGLDAANNVYVAGGTLSSDFPVVGGYQTSLTNPNGSAFVARIDTTQSGQAALVYSSYLGGAGNGVNSIGDQALTVAVDAIGRAYLTGQTASDTSTTPFPTTAGAYQPTLSSTYGNAFFSVVDTNQTGAASLLYSTYLGGSSQGFGDYGVGIAIDALGRGYITGQTTSSSPTPFPTTPTAFQNVLNSTQGNAFVSVIDPYQSGAQSLVYSTYLGGSTSVISADVGSAVAVDVNGYAYVIGDTTSADFPVTANAFQTTNSPGGRAFVAKFDTTQSGASSLLYSTFLGGTNGSEGETGNGIIVDGDGNAFAVGSTSSTDFPVTADAFQSNQKSVSWNAYLAELNPTGTALIYSTYLGGSCNDGDVGATVTLDSLSNAYVVGSTCSTDFPTQPPDTYQTALSGGYDAFITKFIRDPLSITISAQSTTIPAGTSEQLTATGTYADGSTLDLTSVATWTSTTPAVATVASTGLVTGITQGTSVIQASYGTRNASTTITVGPPVLTSIALNPSVATIPVGSNQQFQAVGTFTDGTTQDLTTSAVWSIGSLGVVTMGTPGLFTGTSVGTTPITASMGSVLGASHATVVPPVLISISLLPSSSNVRVGESQQFVATGVYSDGSTQNMTSSVTWTTSNAAVSTVSSTGLASAIGVGTSTITAASGSTSGTAVLNPLTGPITLNTSRYEHSATLLNSGKVLVAGGINCPTSGTCQYLSSAEIYDPTTGVLTNIGSMATARSAPAVLLGSGKVLIAGGYACDGQGNCASLSSAELYDPDEGSFTTVGNMTTQRSDHTLTLLPNGQVLIAGGQTCTSSTSCTALSTAEVYDPVTGTFSVTGSLNAARFNASAVAVTTGKVLVAGGFDGTAYPAAAELYDPVAGTFQTTGLLNTPRANATAIIMDNGQVLIAGGSSCSSPECPTASTEIFDGSSFSYPTYPNGAMTVARADQAGTLLTNGQVFLAGGYDACASSCTSDSTTEVFDPSAYAFSATQALATGRAGHTATLLNDGSVLIVGGINNGVTLASADSFQPGNLSLPQLASITITPANLPFAVGTNVRLVATGYDMYGHKLGLLQAVVWNSSSPAVASITNAQGSSGIVSGRSVGETTITASVGPISATTTIIVTPPLTSISVTPSDPSIVFNSPQELQLTATGIYSDRSSRDLTAFVNWGTSDNSVATVVPHPIYPGIVAPISVGTATISATYAGVSGNTNVTVVAPSVPAAPVITTIYPTGGSAGTQVTITGSGFGVSQGNGTVTLGTTFGSVVSWSDAQVVATVPTGSSSGVAQIQQGGAFSNSVAFSVNTPSITNVSPAIGLPGTAVVITGSGFGATQANGQVWLGTVPAIVTNWSDVEIDATVASGAASGNAQVLQNGVLSNAVPFTINTPQITSVSPNSGGAGTSIIITGSGFGSSQGSGIAWVGSMPGLVTQWGDGQIVASVDANSVSGIVKVQQNGVWSNGVTFTVPPSLGSQSITLVPNVLSMIVGDQRSLQALDSTGHPVTGLAWTSSNTSIAALSTDDPPIITAVAPGNVTIAAGGASADLTIYAGPTYPLGTTIWSASGDGSGVYNIVPAVPSSTGVADVFAIQASGTVLAIKSDGTVAWTANLGAGQSLIADFQGGYIAADSQSARRYDGITGQPYPAYTSTTYLPVMPLVHTDGSLIVINDSHVDVVDPSTGTPKFTVALEQSVYSGNGNCGEYQPYQYSYAPTVGAGIVAGDGYAYIPYLYGGAPLASNQKICNSDGSEIVMHHNELHLRLLRIGTDGSSRKIPIADWAADQTDQCILGEPYTYSAECYAGHWVTTGAGAIPSVTMGYLITNADQGAVYSWAADFGPSSGPQYNLSTISAGGYASTATQHIPGQTQPVQPVLQLEDDSFIGTVFTSFGVTMIGFDETANNRWLVPNYTPQVTSTGGVIAQSSDGVTTSMFDRSGNAAGHVASLPIQSWTGDTYPSSATNMPMPVLLSNIVPVQYSRGYASGGGGSPSASGTYVPTLGAIYRSKIAELANGNVGNSTDWRETRGTTCNIFVRDILKKASDDTMLDIPTPVRPNLKWFQLESRHPFLAADWANPGTPAACWKTLPDGPDGAMPGDVLATGFPLNGPDGTGHVGIIVGPGSEVPNQKLASAADAPPYWWTPQQKRTFIPGTITLTDYGFRLPGFDPNDPKNVQGLEKDSHVRRFSCY